MNREEVFTVTFSSNDNGEAGLAVFKKMKGGELYAIKLETGAQAYDLYFLLTNQAAKVNEMGVDKSESMKMIMRVEDTNMSESMWEQLKKLKNGGKENERRINHEKTKC